MYKITNLPDIVISKISVHMVNERVLFFFWYLKFCHSIHNQLQLNYLICDSLDCLAWVRNRLFASVFSVKFNSWTPSRWLLGLAFVRFFEVICVLMFWFHFGLLDFMVYVRFINWTLAMIMKNHELLMISKHMLLFGLGELSFWCGG